MNQELKKGYTTGTCAMVSALAACKYLLTNEKIDNYLFEKEDVKFQIEINALKMEGEKASCYVIKDSGDDIDITNHAHIYATVRKIEQGLVIKGGKGVGTITKKGLKREIGQSAINPSPLKYITQALEKEIQAAKYTGGLEVIISIPNGETLALETFNPRLGIVGGLSILGSSGIVKPMSIEALLATIQVELKYYQSNYPNQILLLSPGNYGQDFLKANLNIQNITPVTYSNFLAETLDYAIELNIQRILIVSHIAKLIKVAANMFNTHSKYGDAKNYIFATFSAIAGVETSIVKAIYQANTSDEMIALIYETKKEKEIFALICAEITRQINLKTKNKIQVEFIAFNNVQGIILESNHAMNFLKELELTNER